MSTVNQGKKTDPQVSLTTRIAEWQHLRSAPLLKRDLGYRDRVAYVLPQMGQFWLKSDTVLSTMFRNRVGGRRLTCSQAPL
jgi:hypothetical protein